MNDILELITWVDSSSPDGWTHHEDIKNLEPLIIKSAGYVINETDWFITIASHIAEHSVDGIMSIPKICIKTRENAS